MNIDPIARADKTGAWVTLQAIKELFRRVDQIDRSLATIVQQGTASITSGEIFDADSGITLPNPVPSTRKFFWQSGAAATGGDVLWVSMQTTPGVWVWRFVMEV